MKTELLATENLNDFKRVLIRYNLRLRSSDDHRYAQHLAKLILTEGESASKIAEYVQYFSPLIEVKELTYYLLRTYLSKAEVKDDLTLEDSETTYLGLELLPALNNLACLNPLDIMDIFNEFAILIPSGIASILLTMFSGLEVKERAPVIGRLFGIIKNNSWINPERCYEVLTLHLVAHPYLTLTKTPEITALVEEINAYYQENKDIALEVRKTTIDWIVLGVKDFEDRELATELTTLRFDVLNKLIQQEENTHE